MSDEEMEQWRRERIEGIKSHLASLTREQLLGYFGEVAVQIVFLASELDATEWPANLHLADVVEKHIGRSIDWND